MSSPKYQPQLLAIGNIIQTLYYDSFSINCDNNGQIYSTASKAINKVYKKVFDIETQFSDPSVMDFNNEDILEQLLFSVSFQLFKIQIDNLSIFISNLDSIKKNIRPICYSTEWNDKEILIPAFEQHLK
ncbi:1845_t:CDS:2 [Diversispora eburnea]|uniref:1845_t:CDS:1 n=1 Tax=Diversispora eburnea TaxID=1213867 RepID=A0A9N9AGK9_9GLOM|nr:1845_t:CDS:2 [Diversispora eburnea]